MCKINENLNIPNNIVVIDNLTNKKVSEIISNTLSGYTIKDFSIYKPNLAKDYEIENIVNFMKETIENDKIPLISVTTNNLRRINFIELCWYIKKDELYTVILLTNLNSYKNVKLISSNLLYDISDMYATYNNTSYIKKFRKK